MNPSIALKLAQLSDRLIEVDQLLSTEEATKDMDTFRKLNRERAELEPVVTLYHTYQACLGDLATAQEMAEDPEMREFADAEIKDCNDRLAELDKDLQVQLLPKDPNDERGVFLEIRAGTGGMKLHYFRAIYSVCIHALPNVAAGKWKSFPKALVKWAAIKKSSPKFQGKVAYSVLKFESGAHRVQRVPATETQGRVHTSACTVAIMPEVDEVDDVVLNSADLRIDTFRASGAGGQHINKTDSAVRITHLPTGVVVECQDGRSQHQNKAQAMRVLAARIMDAKVREQQSKIAATRKSLVGSGDRSERIRTYNYPQGRVTDHRINLTLYKMDAMMDGDINELTSALMAEHQAEQLAAMSEESLF